jgi:hypothetical protein
LQRGIECLEYLAGLAFEVAGQRLALIVRDPRRPPSLITVGEKPRCCARSVLM